MSEARPFDLTVLGVGNILWADEGFGVRCVEHFHRAFRPMPRSQVLDGGTECICSIPSPPPKIF